MVNILYTKVKTMKNYQSSITLKIKLYLSNMTDDHRAFREWQIHLTMKIN